MTMAAHEQPEERSGMTIESALDALATIESLRDGSPGSELRANMLTNRLLSDPAGFWDAFWTIHNPPSADVIALALTVGLDASLGDLYAAMEANGS